MTTSPPHRAPSHVPRSGAPEAPGRAPTLRDVAARARVSSATASRVVNGSPVVSRDARARVLAAIHELHYAPNSIATSLRRRTTMTVGLLIPDITNQFFAEVARVAEFEFREAGYSCFFCDTAGDVVTERQYAELFRNRRVEGLLVISSDPTAAFFDDLARRGPAVVLVDRPRSDLVDSVRVDNADGVLQAVAHLTARGRRRLAILAGPQSLLPARERLDAFLQGLTVHGLPRVDRYVQVTGFAVPDGYAAVRAMLSLPEPPDAIFASNNNLGIGAIRAIKESGRGIPGDVSLITFDDVLLADLLDPPVTAVAQPTADIARVGVTLLLERLATPPRQSVREVILRPRLIVRGSA